MMTYPASSLDLNGRITVEGDADFSIELEGRRVAVVFPSVRQLLSFGRIRVLPGGRLRAAQVHSFLKTSDLVIELRVKNVVVGKVYGSTKGNWLPRILGIGPIQIDALALLKLLGWRSSDRQNRNNQSS